MRACICLPDLILRKAFSTQTRQAKQKIGFDVEVELITIPMTILGVWPFAKHRTLFFAFTAFVCIAGCIAATKSFLVEWKDEGIYQCLIVLFLFFTTIKAVIYRINENQLKEIFASMKMNWEHRQYLTIDGQTIMSDYVTKSRYIVAIWRVALCVIAIGK